MLIISRKTIENGLHNVFDLKYYNKPTRERKS